MRNNLTKKEIGFVPARELNYRYCWLLQKAETMPAHVLTMADAREVLWIEDELHTRLVALIGHDFYPPEGVAKPTMAELRARLSPFKKSAPTLKPKPVAEPIPKPVQPAVQPAAKEEGKLRFKVAIINTIGSTVTTLNLHVDGKGEAEVVALKTIKQLGLKKATFKIG